MQTVRTDEDIKADIVESMRRDARVDASDVAVEVDERVVALRGTVPTYSSMWAAYDDALLTEGVVRVVNVMKVKFKPSVGVPTDDEMAENAGKLLQWSADLHSASVQIVVVDGVVTLSGSVPTYADKEGVERAVGMLRGVEEVRNELAVVPAETLTDEVIATDIISEMERSMLVDPTDVEVRVVNGVVTLSGEVTTSFSSMRAERIAKNAWGVRDVVNVLNVKFL